MICHLRCPFSALALPLDPLPVVRQEVVVMHTNSVIGALVSSVWVGSIDLYLFGLLGLLGFLISAITSWRTRRLGRRVDLWSDDAARMEALLQAGASPVVARRILQGNKINAIKECRLETGLGLKEAKELVERYQSALYRYEPWNTR